MVIINTLNLFFVKYSHIRESIIVELFKWVDANSSLTMTCPQPECTVALISNMIHRDEHDNLSIYTVQIINMKSVNDLFFIVIILIYLFSMNSNDIRYNEKEIASKNLFFAYNSLI